MNAGIDPGAAPAAFDVLIVGGGPVGAAAGILLLQGANRPLTVGLLEPVPQPPIDPADTRIDARVLAFSRASQQLLQRAGAWEAVRPFAHAYERMRVWHHRLAATDPGVLVFDAAEAGEPGLGWIIESRRVAAALQQRFTAAGGQIIADSLQSLAVTDHGVRVTTTARALGAKLLIGADGARSAVRAAAGLDADATAYGQTAIVARIRCERPHQDTAWQRFLGDGTLALLPLGDGATSIVWSVADAEARRLLALPADVFNTELTRASDDALGALALDGERSSFPLQRLKARRYTAPRIALVGDAAHVVHPLAGQGVNLGLKDAAQLARRITAALGEGEDPGAYGVLRAYERERKADNELMDAAFDAINRFLAHGSGPVSLAARSGLRLVNRAPLLKRFFIEQALD